MRAVDQRLKKKFDQEYGKLKSEYKDLYKSSKKKGRKMSKKEKIDLAMENIEKARAKSIEPSCVGGERIHNFQRTLVDCNTKEEAAAVSIVMDVMFDAITRCGLDVHFRRPITISEEKEFELDTMTYRVSARFSITPSNEKIGKRYILITHRTDDCTMLGFGRMVK